MPIEKLFNIIDEAKKIGVVNFKIIGGDIFMYKEWEKLLEKLKENDYNPCIGTKVPLNEKQIIKLKKIINEDEPIQISLDTLIPENLCKILNVNENYHEKIIN
jgi:molybdenum cofactor biosynthesis enzyme MoaA